MKKVINWLQDNMDKIAHAGLGTYVSWIVASVIGIFTDAWEAPVFFGLIVGSLVGFIKEVVDSNSDTGKSDPMDWVATVCGALAGAVMYIL